MGASADSGRASRQSAAEGREDTEMREGCLTRVPTGKGLPHYRGSTLIVVRRGLAEEEGIAPPQRRLRRHLRRPLDGSELLRSRGPAPARRCWRVPLKRLTRIGTAPGGGNPCVARCFGRLTGRELRAIPPLHGPSPYIAGCEAACKC